jgi:aerobic carbon-monoxide dehydrogenase large subunit
VAIGESVLRVEDVPLITGGSDYVADLSLARQVSAAIVRSPASHGVLADVDLDDARTAPGVVAAWSAADVVADLGAVPIIQPRISFDAAVVPYLQPVLAFDRVRYVGEPVAIVIAENRYLAEDAAELVFVDIEPLPAITDARAAGIEALFPEGNVVTTLEAGFGEPDAVFAEAPVVVKRELSTGRHSAVPIETRGVVVECDSAGSRLVVHGSTKVPHWNRAELARHLDIPESNITMKETAVGGSFGVRGEYYPEDFLVAWAALRLRRPVAWVEDRREHLIAANHSRQQFHRAAIAGDEDGNILALRSEFWADMGAYVRTLGIRVPDLTLSMLPGPYDIPNYQGRAHCVVTNKTPIGTYRAPGRFESCFVRERLIDIYSAEIGADPVEVRRKNLIAPHQMPYERSLLSTGHPVVFNEGNYGALLSRVESALRPAEIERRRSEGECVGAGLAVFLEKSGLGPWESGSVTVDRDGTIVVRSGCTSVGQGLRTILAQIAAEVFDVDIGRVRVELLDTDETPQGIGSYASRSTATAGNAVHAAARAVLDRAKRAAAEHLEVDPADVVVRSGGFEIVGSGTARIELTDIVAKLQATDQTLSAEEVFHVGRLTYPYGVHAAVVSVDRDTGLPRVERLVLGYDVGRAVNPMLVEGQLHGGAVQGVGGALLEQFSYDGEANPLVTSFMDYLMPTMTETPSIAAIVTEDAPTATNPLGVKGAGEGGLTGVAAAIAAAIDDAVGAPGTVASVPVDSHALISALKDRP